MRVIPPPSPGWKQEPQSPEKAMSSTRCAVLTLLLQRHFLLTGLAGGRSLGGPQHVGTLFRETGLPAKGLWLTAVHLCSGPPSPGGPPWPFAAPGHFTMIRLRFRRYAPHRLRLPARHAWVCRPVRGDVLRRTQLSLGFRILKVGIKTPNSGPWVSK